MRITERRLRGIIRSVLKEESVKDLEEFRSELDSLFRTGYFDLLKRKDPSIVKQMGMGFPGPSYAHVIPTEAWNSLRKDLLNSYVKELTTENAVTFFYEKVKNHYMNNKELYLPYLKISKKVTYVPALIFDVLFHCYMWDIHGNTTPGSGRAWRSQEEGEVLLEEYLDTRDAFIRSLSLPSLHYVSVFN